MNKEKGGGTKKGCGFDALGSRTLAVAISPKLAFQKLSILPARLPQKESPEKEQDAGGARSGGGRDELARGREAWQVWVTSAKTIPPT